MSNQIFNKMKKTLLIYSCISLCATMGAWAQRITISYTTVGSYSVPVPASVSAVKGEAWGGGGGGGGAYALKNFGGSVGGSITVVVGAGGAGATNNGCAVGLGSGSKDGNAGDASSCNYNGLTVTAGGGDGGKKGSANCANSSNDGRGGNGGTCSGADICTAGQNGGAGGSGYGGAAGNGGGQTANTSSGSNGANGNPVGGGGGGARAGAFLGQDKNGGNGANGKSIITIDFDIPRIAGSNTFCGSDTLILRVSNAYPNVLYIWKHNNNIVGYDSVLVIPNANPQHSGTYTVEAEMSGYDYTGGSAVLTGSDITYNNNIFTLFSQGHNVVVNRQPVLSVTVHDSLLCSNAVVDFLMTDFATATDDWQSYDFNQNTWISADTHLFINPNTVETIFYRSQDLQTGCISTIDTLTLTVQGAKDSVYSAMIYGGLSYTDGYFTGLTTAGTYFDTLYYISNCDSLTIEFTLLLNDTSFTFIEEAICQGELYDFYGKPLFEAGIYLDTLLTERGYDSIIHLTLIVNDTFFTAFSESICEGRFYDFYGKLLTESGVYRDTLHTIHGCDSIFELTLTVIDTFSTLTASICEWDYYDFFGQQLVEAGVYRHALQNILGCDSIIELTLSINNAFTVIEEAICKGTSYSFSTKGLFSTQGIYRDTLETTLGCDSIIELRLTVNPTYLFPMKAEVCQGETYDFYGKILSETGIYYDTMQTVNGCDSIFKLTFTVNLLPEKPVIGKKGNTLTASTLEDSYQWYLNDTQIENATAQSYKYSKDGIYFVEVGNEHNCFSKSDTIVIRTDSTNIVNLLNEASLRIYPNPVTDKLFISCDLAVTNIEIYDIIGKKAEGGKLPSFGGVGGGFSIDISHLSNGMYYLKIQTEQGTITRKIVKNSK